MAKFEFIEDIECWRLARYLARDIYKLTEEGKLCKDFVMKGQLRRASLSVMNNIAEGFGRRTDAEFARFLDIGVGSLTEVHSMYYLMDDLNYLETKLVESYFKRFKELRYKMLGLIRYLRK